MKSLSLSDVRAHPDALFAGLTILAVAFSVSFTQIFLGFTLLSSVVLFIKDGSDLKRATVESMRNIHPSFLCALGLIAWLICSSLIHFLFWNRPPRIVTGESGDLFLILFGVVLAFLLRNRKKKEIIDQFLDGLIVALVLTGLLSIFSEYRLSKLFMDRPNFGSASNRAQHLFGEYLGFEIFRPIGFQNTRLTFAGQLALVLPILGARLLNFKKQSRSYLTYNVTLFSLGILVLYLNGTRSIWLGLLIVLALFYLFHLKRTNRISLPVFSITLFFIIVLFASSLQPLPFEVFGFEIKRHTDYARPISWSFAFDMFINSPLFGTGPGYYVVQFKELAGQFIMTHPETWYFVSNTPSGHAHNDLLHFAAIGGVPALCLFVGIIFFLFKDRALSPYSFACAVLLFAGLTQCYLLDDEVSILFWSLIAFGITESGNAYQNTERSYPKRWLKY